MNRRILFLSAMVMLIMAAAACGEVSEPETGGQVASSKSSVVETPPATIAASVAATAPGITPNGSADATTEPKTTSEQSGSGRLQTPPATIVATIAATVASTVAFNEGATAPAGSAPTASGGAGSSAKVGPSGEVTPAEPTPEAESVLAQALDSPGLMWCLSDNVGMQTLIQLQDRAATGQEARLIASCVSDREEVAAWDAEWPKRIDAAFAPAVCGAAPANDFPASYYRGPLIDTHLHIPQLPDDGLGDTDDDNDDAPRGVDSDAYDAIAEDQRPLLGKTMDINTIACTLKNEGTVKAFAFFPTFPQITLPAIQVAQRALEEYPSLFVPFIQASGNVVSTVEAEILEAMLGVRPEVFAGFGEVGDSPTEPINPPPDSDIYTGDFEVARDRNLMVYFHPGEGHNENLERALQSFPEISFIVHGDVIRPHIDGIMDRHPNVYFTFNDIFDELIPTFRFGEKETFISDMKQDWDRMLDSAVEMYRPLIEAHPDRYMWGTDRVDIVWNYDAEVGQLLAEYARAFIGRFDPLIQADLAYQNAERLIAKNAGS